VQSKFPKDVLRAEQAVHSESQQDQILMKLCPKFKSIRAGLIDHKPIPTLDECLGELLREEQRLASQHGIAQDTVITKIVNMAYAAQGKGRSKSLPQCYNCKEFGHIAKNCNKKFCNYCKKKVTLLRTIAYDIKIDLPMPCILLSSPTL